MGATVRIGIPLQTFGLLANVSSFHPGYSLAINILIRPRNRSSVRVISKGETQMRNFKMVLIALLLGTCMVTSPVLARPWNTVSCQTIITEKSWSASLDSAAEYLENHSTDGKFGSVCNQHSYIEAECLSHPNDTLGKAVNRLLQGASLPNIPRCGA
jgi:hypothetical protein